jgi:protein-disulfide isomerase
VRRNKSKTARRNRTWIVVSIIAILFVAALIVINDLTLAAPPQSATSLPSTLDQCGKPECGQPNAPVTIDLYADFQCPFCAQADRVIRQLAPKYIETGKAKLIYHNFPIIGPESQTAAQAAECAADQNAFWRYGNYLFTHQASENSGALSRANLISIAGQLKLNTQTFSACLNSGKYANLVQQQLAEGQARGVTGTPTFFINGNKYEGVLSVDQLSALIDAGQPP